MSKELLGCQCEILRVIEDLHVIGKIEANRLEKFHTVRTSKLQTHLHCIAMSVIVQPSLHIGRVVHHAQLSPNLHFVMGLMKSVFL